MHSTGATTLRDRYGRVVTYLRVSVTDRCNLRCFYCLPQGRPQGLPRGDNRCGRLDQLSLSAIGQVVRSGVG